MQRRGLISSIQYILGYKLTPVGRALVLVMFVSAIGSVTVELPIYQVFCCLSAVLFSAEMTGIFVQPKLEAKVWLPSSVPAGSILSGSVNITNKGRWTAFDVMYSLFGLPRGMQHLDGELMIPTLPSGASATLPVSIQTSQRGVFELPPLRPHSTFPFNVMRFGRTSVSLPPVHILPRFQALEQLNLPATSRYQPGGVLIEGRVGASSEYIGNREYTFGEPVQRLDFRAWARLGKPVVREYQEEYCTRIAIILDTFGTKSWLNSHRQQQHARFEAAISVTAALAHALQTTEAIIELFAAGPELYVFRAATPSIHFEKLLEILAGAEATYRNPFEELSPAVAGELESVSTVLCILLDWDATRAEFVQSVRDAGCEVRVILIRGIEATQLAFPEEGEEFQRHSPEAILKGEVTSL